MGTRYLAYFEFPRYRNTVLAKWMERPDWNLLLPMLNPALPPAERRRVQAHAAQASALARGETGGARDDASSRSASRPGSASGARGARPAFASQRGAESPSHTESDAMAAEVRRRALLEQEQKRLLREAIANGAVNGSLLIGVGGENSAAAAAAAAAAAGGGGAVVGGGMGAPGRIGFGGASLAAHAAAYKDDRLEGCIETPVVWVSRRG